MSGDVLFVVIFHEKRKQRKEVVFLQRFAPVGRVITFLRCR
jgi:hypothetical protein